jgi:hypothetical protein
MMFIPLYIEKLKFACPAGSVPSLSHLTSFTPTKSNSYWILLS